MGLNRDDLALLVDAFERSEWTEMVLRIDGTRVELTTTGRPPEGRAGSPAEPGQPGAAGAPAAVPALPATAAAVPATAAAPGAGAGATAPPAGAAPEAGAPPAAATHDVVAPSVGIFYRAPEPGAPPFVEKGARVAPDDIVCIVEVMKLMNHVKAGVAGTVRAIHVENGAMIEHGQALFTIDLDA